MSRRSRAESAAALDSTSATDTVSAPAAETPAPAIVVTGTAATFAELNPGIIIPSPLNPRRGMDRDGLDELAASIVANGVLQPILVRPSAGIGDYVRVPGEDQWYEVICGARRLAAVTLALQDGRLPQDFRIPARIRKCGDAELVLLAATENLARADMHPLDEAEVFAAMRPHVKPQDGQTTEAAIGKALGVSERTVFRRLALLRCAPEVREALRDKKITLAHAQAYSMGPAERQQEVLADQLAGRESNYGEPISPADIKYEFTEADDNALISVNAAIFDPAEYAGEIIEDHDTGDRYFADKTEFDRLQDRALQVKVDELRQEWPWVDIDRRGYLRDWQTYSVRKNDEDAGAVVTIRGGAIEVHAPALRYSTLKERNHTEATAPASGGRTNQSSTAAEDRKLAAPRPPLSQTQLEQLHAIKTQALRRAIAARETHGGRVPMALACLGMLGAGEIRHLKPAGDQFGDRPFPVPNPLAESTRLEHLLKTVSLELPEKLRKRGAGDAPAEWFGALMSLSPEDLNELFALLVAERCGSWLAIDKPGSYTSVSLPRERLGDSPLAQAIAVYTGADQHLGQMWQVDRSWFEQYGKDRLFAIAHGQCHIRNANQLKKGQLVDVVMEQPKGFWTASLFPEATFQSEAEAEKALDLTKTPLPHLEPTREAAE